MVQNCIRLMITLAVTTSLASAQGFSITSLQGLYGGPFKDSAFGNNTADRKMLTLTLEHFGASGYGDTYFFVDLLFGRFVDSKGERTGQEARVYTELSPRLSIGKISKRQTGFTRAFKDIFLAGQVNVDGGGFWAYMIGVGFDFNLPAPFVAGTNVYYRKDRFNGPQYQVTGFWEVPFRIRRTRLLARGFIDFAGTDRQGLDINSQPQLLLDVGPIIGVKKDNIQFGVELYVHRNGQISVIAPQAVLRWVL